MDPESKTSVIDEDAFLWSLIQFMIDGGEREEARLLFTCSLVASEEWNRGFNDADRVLRLEFSGPRQAYERLSDTNEEAYAVLDRAATALLPSGFDYQNIVVRAQISSPPANWREEALEHIEGGTVNNQAKGHEPVKHYEGLGYRSESEVRIARALDEARVMYLANSLARVGVTPNTRRTVEADFIVMLHPGHKWGILEVDGKPFHPAERSAKEHERDRVFSRHGAAIVSRFDAERCYKEPDRVVAQFLELLKNA